MNFNFLYRKSLPIFMTSIIAFSSLNISSVTVSAETITAPTEAETTENTPAVETTNPEEGDRANSFRYINGTSIFSNKIFSKAATSSTAWTKVNGSYVNDVGAVIPNAVAKGIDVSHHQGEIDWKKVKASDIDFAIVRCGYGQDLTSQDDKYWVANATACTENNIPFGTYIYSYATSKSMAVGEANHVLRLIKGYDLQYPIYYDLEDASQSGFSAQKLANIAEAFCSTIEAAGYKAAIYANTNWFTTKLTNPVFDNYDRWVAQYNSTCTYTKPYSMWQCTSTGSVPGISGNVDLNFVVQSEPLVPVTSLTISNKTIQMKTTDTTALNVNLLPHNAFNKQISYSSSDDTIASVDKNGIVSAHKEGIVTITAQSAENSSVKATCTVTVSNVISTEQPEITSTPIPTEISVPTSTPVPEETSIPTDTPVSEETSIPTDTLVPEETSTPTNTPVSIETPVPTNTPIPTETSIPTNIPVSTEQPLETITLNKTTLTITNGDTFTLSATTNSLNEISWSSSNKNVASVSTKGIITAKTPGKAVITAKITDGLSASCVVYVKPSKTTKADFTPVSTRKLTLTWTKVSGASGYAIYRYNSTTGEDILIKSLSSSKLSYTFNKLNGSSGSALTAGGKYTFKIAAYTNIDGKKYYGTKYTIKTATKPKKSTIKTLKKRTSRSMKITWSKISASDGYIIYISNGSTSKFRALRTIDSSATTSYTATQLTKGKTYYVKICAYRKINGKIVYSNYSNTKKLKLN